MSPEDLAKFRARFPELDAWLWDRQIEEDFEAGRLDGLLAEAREDIRQKIALGLEQAERGELFDGEEVFQAILEELETPKELRSRRDYRR